MIIKITDERWINEDYIQELIMKERRIPGEGSIWVLSLRTPEGVDILKEGGKKEVEGLLHSLLTKINPNVKKTKG